MVRAGHTVGVCGRAWVVCVGGPHGVGWGVWMGAVRGCCAWVGQVNAVDLLGGVSCISDSVAPTY